MGDDATVQPACLCNRRMVRKPAASLVMRAVATPAACVCAWACWCHERRPGNL